ncbi:formylglycine-generating enzyme family protein, partial [Opitutales bacterium]|nr:formylglycine-generating enzyme family protein [Opitutales bacterium]
NGSIDSNITAGSKTATWNAESDWNQQFTANGKIRVIATYGNQPSGFTGSGGGGNTGGSGQADASLKSVFMDVLWLWDYNPNTTMNEWMDRTDTFQYDKINSQIRVDPTEITNAKWNEVAEWAIANNYSGLPLASDSNASPRTNVTFWEVIKWCNARSEKDGLIPAYYTDGNEATGDVNGNGVVDTGPDTWTPYDFAQDPNQNGVYDNGEPYTDSDVNDGPFNPKEYYDANNNGQYDPGLTNPYRQGSSVSFDTYFHAHADANATGYRLPTHSVFVKLASGGSNKTNWPWGANGPDQYAQFTSEFRVPATNNWGDNIGTSLSEPTPATRPANGYDLKDLIGNVAEFSEDAMDNSSFVGGAGGPDLKVSIFGGSYLGLKKVHPDPFGSGFEDNQMQVERYSDLFTQGPLDAGSPAVGFRCFTNN